MHQSVAHSTASHHTAQRSTQHSIHSNRQVPRLPNVDINNEHIAISSLNQAGKLLMDAATQDSATLL